MVNLCAIFIDDSFVLVLSLEILPNLTIGLTMSPTMGSFAQAGARWPASRSRTNKKFSMRGSTTGVPRCFLVVQFHLHAIINLKSARDRCDRAMQHLPIMLRQHGSRHGDLAV